MKIPPSIYTNMTSEEIDRHFAKGGAKILAFWAFVCVILLALKRFA